MDAVEFLKERKRLCEVYFEKTECKECPLENMGCWTVDFCKDDSCEKVIAIVEKWSKEHPRKTRQSVFLKMFPHVILNDKGQPGFCPKTLDTEYKPVGACVLDVDICQRCMDKFWSQEVE
jgi:hypothetical protein